MAGIQLTFKEFDIVKKFENSNATVSELRTGVFAPIEKISSKSKTYTQFIENQKKRFIETSWGKTVIKGNILTQTHRDLLDCLFAGAKECVAGRPSGGAKSYRPDPCCGGERV